MKNPEVSPFDEQEQDSSAEQPFLRRWSKRKLDATSAPVDGVDDAATIEPAIQQQEVNHHNSEPEQTRVELTDEDMPPLETLDENSDFSGFLSPKVSETLRRAALRKLFHFQQFNITDGLNDYDDDYTQFEKLGNVVTHEMKRLLEQGAEKSTADADNNQQQQTTAQQLNQNENSNNEDSNKAASCNETDADNVGNVEKDKEIDINQSTTVA